MQTTDTISDIISGTNLDTSSNASSGTTTDIISDTTSDTIDTSVKRGAFRSGFSFRLIVFAQIAAIFIFNLTRLKYEVGFDSSAAMAQAMEIWHQKTIFLQHWQYQTTLGLDSVILLASLLYGVTHNIFISYGIADCIGVLLYLYVFRDIMHSLGVKRLARIILYMILLTPYSLEPLGYMPMMFTGAAYYVIKTLIPVMLIAIMLKLHKGTTIYKVIPFTLLFLIFTWLTAFSCGLYLFICGILPIIVYELWLVIASGKLHTIRNIRILILVLTIFSYGSGYLAAKLYGASVFTSDMVLCEVSNIADNFSKWFIGIFELFGAVPSQHIIITSAFGIHYLSHMAAALTLGIILFMVFKKFHTFASVKNGSNKQHVIAMAGCIMLFNAIVLLLTNTTYGSDSYEFRYHLLPVVTSMLIVGIGIDQLLDYFINRGNQLIKHTFLLVISTIWILSNIVFVYYYSTNNNYVTCQKILSSVETDTNCKMMYFIGPDDDTIDSARLTRLMDTNMIVINGYNIDEFIGWGASTKYFNLENYDGSIATICKTDTYNDFPDDMKEELYLSGNVGDYQIYVWNRQHA